MKRLAIPLATAALAVLALAAPAPAAEAEECTLELRTACYGLASVGASLSTTGTQAGLDPYQAGAHPDLNLDFALKEDPKKPLNPYGRREPYAHTRDIITETPPGLVGNPNVLGGLANQCKAQELIQYQTVGCPNGSQVGLTKISLYAANNLCEPIYMMVPPGGDTVARFGFIAGLYPFFIDFKVRSEGDYGLTAEIVDSPSLEVLIEAKTTIWGVPADPIHDTERIVPGGLEGRCESGPRPPGSAPLPFLTNPTRCEPGGDVAVRADSWELPGLFSELKTPLPEEFTGCDQLPFGPSLTATPTSARAGAPTGLNLTIKLPAAEGAGVLEPSQTRYMRIDFPPGMAFNTGSADGLETCSAAQARYGEDAAAECPDGAKLAFTEFDVPVLERNLKGAIYLREPQPGDPFRIWILADDLGLHIKLPADLQVDKATGQIHSIVLGTPQTEGLPQAPLREVKLFLKSGFRAPLVNPERCGTYHTHYEFTPWSGGPPATGDAPMQITEGCDTGGFSPKLQAGTTSPQAGTFSPFVFTLSREDGEQNPASLDISMPKGLAASFAGIPLCEGQATQTGACPPDSKIGHVEVAVGAGPAPLWVPQEGKRPTAVYLSGPYKGAPLSILAVVPKQAGPFDFGDEVVRSAIYVDPETAQATIRSDPLPQLIEGIPVRYRTISVVVDRPGFTLNPTNCEAMAVGAKVTSTEGAVANPSSRFQVGGCRELGFKPALSLKLKGGGTKRGGHPALTAVLKARAGDANIAGAKVTLPHSEFLDQGHIRTVCTRVQFAAKECPAASIYGYAVAKTPLFDTPLEGPVYLRSSSHNLPDMVLASLHSGETSMTLMGPASRKGSTLSITNISRNGHPVNSTFRRRILTSARFAFTPAPAPRRAQASKKKHTGSGMGFSGSMVRGGNPALSAVLTMNGGPEAKHQEANIKTIQVQLPHSAFLDQAHIRTVCTRVQFAAGSGNGTECPAGSIYGHAKVLTPILDFPLEGNVYLRSSNHPLPDMVIALIGPASMPIAVDLVGRIDSKNGGIRSTFENAPDAPVHQVFLEMEGGKRGLIENSTNLCTSTNNAIVNATGQNGKTYHTTTPVTPECPKHKKKAKGHKGAKKH